jgi:hypothetical protein
VWNVSRRNTRIKRLPQLLQRNSGSFLSPGGENLKALGPKNPGAFFIR